MSKEAMDDLVRRAVSDAAFREGLADPQRFSAAVEGYDLTPDEIDRLKRLMGEKRGTTLPFAQGLSERLSK